MKQPPFGCVETLRGRVAPALLALALPLGCSVAPEATRVIDADAEPGVLEGTVTFVGLPCPPGSPPGPPCDGPYPGFEVVVFHEDGRSEAARTVSDDSGGYRLLLPPGAYTVYSLHAGEPAAGEPTRVPSTARVQAGQTTRLDITVDTGIR